MSCLFTLDLSFLPKSDSFVIHLHKCTRLYMMMMMVIWWKVERDWGLTLRDDSDHIQFFRVSILDRRAYRLLFIFHLNKYAKAKYWWQREKHNQEKPFLEVRELENGKLNRKWKIRLIWFDLVFVMLVVFYCIKFFLKRIEVGLILRNHV